MADSLTKGGFVDGDSNGTSLQGVPITTGTPTDGQALTYDATSATYVLTDRVVTTDAVLRSGTQALTGAWDAGAFAITAETFVSDVAIGTAPLTVTSTTVVTNLNADLLDGNHAAAFEAAGTTATHAALTNPHSASAASGANSDITSLAGLTTALSIAQGGTAATSAGAALSSLGAAALGANSDITSIAGLTTALSVAQGGTGATTASTAFAALKQTATTSATGVVECAIASEINTGTAATLANTPDALAGSYAGTKSVGLCLFQADTAVSAGDGITGIPIPASMNGMNIVDMVMSVDDKGVTSTTTMNLRRRRAGSDVDVFSSALALGDAWFASGPSINASNDDLATGDILYPDVDSIHSGTAPNGLSVAISARLP